MSKRDEESGNRRAYARETPKAEPYEDPIDRQARESETIDDRVRAIALLLSQGRWSKTKALQYANLWAVSLKTVSNYACEANRLRKEIKGAAGLKNAQKRTLDQLQAAYELAMGQGDAKAAVAAARTMGEIRGAFPAKSVGKGAPAASPGASPPMPPAVAALAESEAGLRFWALTGKRPTKAQLAQLEAGVPPEEVARTARASQGSPASS